MYVTNVELDIVSDLHKHVNIYQLDEAQYEITESIILKWNVKLGCAAFCQNRKRCEYFQYDEKSGMCAIHEQGGTAITSATNSKEPWYKSMLVVKGK